MIQEGQIVLFKFPQTDIPSGKLRPALKKIIPYAALNIEKHYVGCAQGA